MLKRIIGKLDIYRIFEDGFLLLMGFYLLFLVEKSTTFHFEYPINVEKYLLYVIFIVTVIKLSAFAYSNREKYLSEKKEFSKACIFILVSIFVFFVYYMVYRSDGYKFLLYMGVLSIGVIGTDYKKVMRYHVVFAGLMIGSAIIAAISGIIDNYAYIDTNGGVNSSWGIVCTSDLASCLIFLCIMAWIAWNKVNSGVFIFFVIIALLNSVFITRSVTSKISGIILLVLIAVEWIMDTSKGDYGFIKKILSIALQIAFPFFAIVIYICEFFYYRRSSIGYKLDSLLHGRLVYIDNGFRNYGITLFGTPFRQIGNGGSTFRSPDYNFIDSTYVLVLLRYGLVLFLVIMFLWILATRKAIKIGDWRLAMGMGLIALHSFSEHHFPEINYNILVVLPFSILGMGWIVDNNPQIDIELEKKRKYENINSYKYIAGVLTGLSFLVVILFGGPLFTSWLRTIWDVTEGVSIRGKKKLLCAALMILIILLIISVVALYRLMISILNETIGYNREKKEIKGNSKKKIVAPIFVLCVALTIFVIVFFEGNHVISYYGKRFSDAVSYEEKAFKTVQKAEQTSGGKLYIDEMPNVYDSKYGGVSKGFMSGEELAFRDRTTILMDADYEANNLMKMGFVYTEISDEHAFYTNDLEVIKSLNDAGYHLTGYYSRKRVVDLKNEAEICGLDLNKDGSIIVNGKDKSLNHGPYYDLREGVYTICFKLSLPNNQSYEEDYKLCTLRVSIRNGSEVLKEVPVFRSQFDNQGEYQADIKCDIPDARWCEFLVIADQDNRIIINEISCQKTPDMDVHIICNKYGKRIKEEYYDLEGHPLQLAEGQYGCELDYTSNEDAGPTFRRFLGLDGRPTTLSSGYSGIGLHYNIRNLVSRREYYNENDERVLLDNGSSAEEYEYDEYGNIIEIRYFDTLDKPVMTTGGYAILRRKYNSNKMIVREEYYDTSDNPVAIPDGYSAVEFDYDANNMEVARRFYDNNNNMIVSSLGYAGKKILYDDEGRIVQEEYYSDESHLINPNGNCAIVKYSYDLYGNQSEISYFGIDEKPFICSKQYSKTKRIFDENSRLIREEFYGADDELTLTSLGYAIIEHGYDESGRENYQKYYGSDGKPLTLSSGYAIIRFLYDESGNQTDVLYYNVDDEPVLIDGLYFQIHREYSEDKQEIKESYLDLEGNKIERNEGYYINERIYDDEGYVIVQRYLDEFEKAVMRTDGFSEARNLYNEKGQVVRTDYYDNVGQKVLISTGYASVENSYDESGNLIEERFFDTVGEPAKYCDLYYGFRRVFNEFNQVSYEEYIDENGNIFIRPDGFAATEREYDSYGNIIELRYLDINKNYIRNIYGYSILRREYDEGHRIIKESYYDSKFEPVDSIDGYTTVEYEYDVYGNKIKTVKTNSDGEIVE